MIIVFITGAKIPRGAQCLQKEIAALCRQEGADIIIGSHPHVIQPMEWDKADSMGRENLVVWSLGNFVSNQRNRYTDGGAMVGITLRKENGKTTIRHADYQLNWVYNPYQQGKKQYYILPVTSFENDSAFLLPESLQALRLFTADSRELLFRNRNIEEKNKK
jgi:poly-gamma-glutamate synthesis protein (capsule biosynthesis protein)